MNYLEKHPMIMIVIGVIGISLSAIFVKYSQAPSVVTAAYRLLWSVFLMAPAVLGLPSRRRELFSADKKTVLLCAAGGFFLALHFILWFESLRFTSVASSTTIVCTEVIWVALGFCLLLGGKISKKAALAIAVTLLGSVLIAWSDSASGKNHLFGDVLALAAAVSSAVYTLIGRIARRSTSNTVYTFILYVFCSLALLAITAIQGCPLTGYGTQSVLVGLLLAVFSTILGHSIFSWCLKYLSPAFVSASKLCEPAAASVFAMLLFGEIPGLLQVIGGAVILGGVLFYSRVEQG